MGERTGNGRGCGELGGLRRGAAALLRCSRLLLAAACGQAAVLRWAGV